ncbi:VWA domain-containing protein [Veillonella sp. AF42-16]|uniref:VWA domain-containing protein n=1 Tax=Veillonella sp. AF42-16 TaxID=2292078 RepID=UPI000E5D9209|nr:MULTISPECIES: VWA domain-containing protein [Veillonella]MDK7740281.1 VWA domain-containing protein [Veillonella nakazawae]MDU2555942.1 VWA domain-containing protein [Veillonella sp.]MDU2576215.1 VWA domain-containing protein [Veillonella sp.]RHK65081.1 VWA domain-containing protein [Veillonella sp. AF42-16]
MDTSVQEALKIGLVNDQIHSVVISGGTGVGKSFLVRQCLEKWHIPYRLIPVYIDNSQLQETIDFEASLQQGQMVMNAGLLDDPHTRCWLLDDGQVLSPDVRHALLVEAKRRHILLIMTINHEDRTLTDAEWELVDVHVAMERASLESRVAVLQQIRDEISCVETVLPLKEAYASDVVVSLIDNKRISAIATPDAMMSLAVSYALQARTVGHGAEYVLLQVMKSLALLEGSSYCKPRHAELAALYVLPHRMKKAEISESQPSPGENSSSTSEQDCTQSNDTSDSMDSDVSNDCEQDDSNRDELYPNESNPNESNANDADDTDIDSAEDDDADSSEANGSSNSSESKDQLRDNATNDMGDICDQLSSLCLPDTVARIANQLFQWKLESSKTVDRQYRKGSGRRLMTKTRDTRGRMIRAYQDEHALEDLALVDTLRAAAPYQRLRAASKMEQEKLSTQSQQLEHQSSKGLSIVVKPQDYRRKAREKRIGAYQLFVVDASGSMAARHRMEATKAAILSLLRDSYIHRDSVGLIAFRKESAEVLLPFTRSVERAERLLASMPTGGKTPLAHGLRMAYTMCDRLLRAHKAERIQIICITDGRATSGDSDDPVAESKRWARIVGTLPVDCIVIDTETGFIKLGLAKELCKLMNGSYYAMDTISADRILRVSRR